MSLGTCLLVEDSLGYLCSLIPSSVLKESIRPH